MKAALSRRVFLALLAICLLLPAASGPAVSAASGDRAGKPERLETWAVPLHAPGLPNLHKVADGLYRSGQPTEEGMRSAEGLGIRAVLSFRSTRDDDKVAAGTTLLLWRVPMRAWSPRHDKVMEALRLMSPESVAKSGPLLVHCWHGADRTGMMVAMYRMVYQNWAREDAIAEMLEGGYGYHTMWKDIVTFLREVDVEAIRAELGMPVRL